jgi:N-acetylglucosaminyl-diphospho-decaprenol L-rhamnosyltransferase
MSIQLSIIIVAWNVKDVVERCLDALEKSKDSIKKEVLFVDNGSSDGTADLIKEKYPDVILIESPTNLGFIRANNLAYEQAKGKYILMLNSDAFVFEETLQKVVDYMETAPDVGALGARLIGTDGKLQESARYFPTPFRLLLKGLGMEKIPFIPYLDDTKGDHTVIRECDWVVGCFLLTRKELIDQMGFFLREDYFLYNDDNDLCLRIKKLGSKVMFFPTDVIHLGGENAKQLNKGKKTMHTESLHIESQYIYFRKNYHLGTVLSSFLSLFLLDSILLLKKIILPWRYASFRSIFSHMGVLAHVLFKTRFGSKSIH